jgi:glycosyltransferase involved in cell wall biosynthesis
MQNSPPLVTVIVLCYNHAKYLREAIQSVVVQDYNPVEIIIVDDASTDGSREVTKKILADYPEIKGILFGREPRQLSEPSIVGCNWREGNM